jgi:L-lysine 6-transaminase
MRRDERVLMLTCGPRSIRFRPSLAVGEDELTAVCGALDRVLSQLEGQQ